MLLVAALMLTLAACGGSQTPPATNDGSGETQAATPAPAEPENLAETQKIIQEAQGMTLEELAKKAIEESNGKMFYGVGNSSQGKSALPLFIEYLQSIDSSYTLEFEWQQPKNNKIFDQLTADSLKDTGTFAMTLIQDGNQIESKMVQTGILDTPKWKTMCKITLPMIKPAILSTILLVFGSSMGSYPVPHYLGLTTLSTKYVSMNSKYTGEASILAIIMMVFGVAIMLLNQLSLHSRENYTTVTGKSGQISKINLGRLGRYLIALILVIVTFFTSIFPIVSFAFETFLPNPGDYSFLYTGNASNLTTKWWVTSENITENGMYGQKGILHNETIWNAFVGTICVSVACALLAGTIGTLIGYAVSKNRRSRGASYVNSMAFLPYLMPSIAVGAAFFILFSNEHINLFNTYTLLIIVGTIKYIPFASRSSLNSMLQLSGEIEESAIIQNIPWVKRMTHIIIPIQKSSIISGYMLPFMTCLRELSLFMLLCTQGFILSTTLDYFDEMGLYAFSSGINLILIITILVCNTIVNKLTGASLDKGIGG